MFVNKKREPSLKEVAKMLINKGNNKFFGKDTLFSRKNVVFLP
nr:MAG TPA: hypothetical protein [Caudoviricetes sp.]